MEGEASPPYRQTRSQATLSAAANAFASSETPRVTTETIVGSRWGEYSSASLPQDEGEAQTTSATASNVAASGAEARARSW